MRLREEAESAGLRGDLVCRDAVQFDRDSVRLAGLPGSRDVATAFDRSAIAVAGDRE